MKVNSMRPRIIQTSIGRMVQTQAASWHLFLARRSPAGAARRERRHAVQCGKGADARPAVSMAALRAAVGQLGLYDPDAEAITPEALRRIAVRLVAQMPTIVAAYYRTQQGRPVVAPRDDLDHAANFLYMLNDQEPDE